jgi:hypothetical protein
VQNKNWTMQEPDARRKKHTCRGLRLTVLLMWDALFHRKHDPHMQRAMELSNYPDKREDEIHRGD